jgi:hypothetical protein
MNKRRRMILGGIGIAAALGAGAIGVGDYLTEAEISSAVRRRLPMLKLDEAGVHAFAHDKIAELLSKRPSWKRVRTRVRTALAKPPIVNFGVSTDRRGRRERYEEFLATVFLLSSDFFWKGSDASRTVQYVALYDPMRACSNPFARLAMDPEAKA